MKLNLGCGWSRREGWVNVDFWPGFEPDRVWNLEEFPWPWVDGSVERIAMVHVLEHLGQQLSVFVRIMQEMWRVLRPDGEVQVVVPHPLSWGQIGGADHVRMISVPMLNQFSRAKNLEWRRDGWPNTPLALMTGVDFEITRSVNVAAPAWARKVREGEITLADLEREAESHFGVIDEIDMTLVRRDGPTE